MTLRRNALTLVATFAVVATHLVGQGKPPTLTSSLKQGNGLQVAVTHEARAWEDRDSKRKLGSLNTKKPILLGGRAIDKGTFTLAIETDASGDCRLQVLPKSRKDSVLAWELEPSEAESRRLRLALRADSDDSAVLDVEFGKLRASLSLVSVTAAEAALKKDPAIRAVDAMLDKANINKNGSAWRTKMPKPEPVEFDPKREYFWHLQTSEGRIVIRLMPDVAPMHVTSTISLTRAGFYDGLGFHRVITGFMAQGGCSTGTGTGSCGYTYDGEIRDDVVHDRPGLLSMANSGPGTDGSQFFITFAPAPHLDGKHTIFGEVVDGMKSVKRLEKAGSKEGEPAKQLTIESARISIR